MKKLLFIILFFFFKFSFGQLVINELDCDTVSTDTKEFIEIKSNTPNFPLDGFVVVLFNGSSNGGDSSYYTIDLDGYTTDVNGLLLIGSNNVLPVPQFIIPTSVIQNGADAVAIYTANDWDFPDGTLATTANLVDALVYETSDPNDTVLMSLLGVTIQIDENINGNKTTESIQRNNNGTYFVATPTPRQLNDGTGIVLNGLSISVANDQYNEGDSFDITFALEENATQNLSLLFTLNNYGFTTSDFTGVTSLTIPQGQNSVTTTIQTIDDTFDEGDEVLKIHLTSIPSPFLILNNNIELRVVDNDYQIANYGTPINPTYAMVQGTQPTSYYASLDGLSSAALRNELQAIISERFVVRSHSYADARAILREADQNPENSNQVWLAYTEQGRAKLDYQYNSVQTGKWNREHTFPRSLANYFTIEYDDIADGINNYHETHADSLRQGVSDAHALRVVDAIENSNRSNLHYGQYNGPTGNLGSFKGDVARSVLFMDVRYNGLSIENGYPTATGQMGDLVTLLNWHRNDPPDDYEMHRNNVVYTWQNNRNPFIDHPNLVEYIWGNQMGNTWQDTTNTLDFYLNQVTIYPIPTKNSLQINGINKSTKMELFTLLGKKVLTKELTTNTSINTTNYSGIYTLKLTALDKTRYIKVIIH